MRLNDRSFVNDALWKRWVRCKTSSHRQPRPDELAELIPSRPPLTDPPAVPLDIGVTAEAAGTPHAEVVGVEGATGQVRVEVQGAAVIWKSSSSHTASPVG